MNWCIFWRKWHKEASSHRLLQEGPLWAQQHHSGLGAHGQHQSRDDTFRLENPEKNQNEAKPLSAEPQGSRLLLGNLQLPNSPNALLRGPSAAFAVNTVAALVSHQDLQAKTKSWAISAKEKQPWHHILPAGSILFHSNCTLSWR